MIPLLKRTQPPGFHGHRCPYPTTGKEGAPPGAGRRALRHENPLGTSLTKTNEGRKATTTIPQLEAEKAEEIEDNREVEKGRGGSTGCRGAEGQEEEAEHRKWRRQNEMGPGIFWGERRAG
jgi:hypothetical protein